MHNLSVTSSQSQHPSSAATLQQRRPTLYQRIPTQAQGTLTEVQKRAFEEIRNQNLQVGDTEISCKNFSLKLWTGLSQVPGWIVDDILLAGGVANQVMGADTNFTFRPPNDWDFKVLLSRPQYANYASFDLLANAVLQVFLAHRRDPQIPVNDFTTKYRKPLVTITSGNNEWALDSYKNVDVLLIVKQEHPFDFPSSGLGISLLHSSQSGEPLARSFSGDYKASLDDLRTKTLHLIDPETLRHGFKNYIKHLCNGFVDKHKESEAILITKFLQEMGNGLENLQSTIRKYLENHYATDSNGQACYLINFLLATHSIDKWKTVHNSLLPLLRSTTPEDPFLKNIILFLDKSPEVAHLTLIYFQSMAISSQQKAASFSYSFESKELLHGESAAIQMKFVAKDQSASYLIFKKQSLEEVTSKLAPLVETSSFSLKEMGAFLDFIQPERFNKLKKKLSQSVINILSGATFTKYHLSKVMHAPQEELQPFLLDTLRTFQKFDDKTTSSLLSQVYKDLFQSHLSKTTLPQEKWFSEPFQEEFFEIFLSHLKTLSPILKEHLDFFLQLLIKTNSSLKIECFEQLLHLLPEGSKEAWDLYLMGKELELISESETLSLFLYAFPSTPNEMELKLLQDVVKSNPKRAEKALEIYEMHVQKIFNTSKEQLQDLYEKWIKPVACSESMLKELLTVFKNNLPHHILFDQSSLYSSKRPLHLNERFKELFLEFQHHKDLAFLNAVWDKAEPLGLTTQELKLARIDYLLQTFQESSYFTAFELLIKEAWTFQHLKKKKEHLNTVLIFFKDRSHLLSLDETSQNKLFSFASQQSHSLNTLLSTKKLSKEQKENLQTLSKEAIPSIAILGLSGPEGLFKAQELLSKLVATSLGFEPYQELSLFLLQQTASSSTTRLKEAVFVDQFLKKCWGSSQAQELLFQFMNKACRHEVLLISISDLYLDCRPSSLTTEQANDLLTFTHSLLHASTSINNACKHILEAYNNKTYEPSTFSSLSEKLTQCLINQKNDAATIQFTLKTISTIAPDLYLKHVEALIPSAEFEMLQPIWDSIIALQLDQQFDPKPLFDRLCLVNRKENLSLAKELFSKIFNSCQQIPNCLQLAKFLHNHHVESLQTFLTSKDILQLLSQAPSQELISFTNELMNLLLKASLNNPSSLTPFARAVDTLAMGDTSAQIQLDQQLFHLLTIIQTKETLRRADFILTIRTNLWTPLVVADSYVKLIQACATCTQDNASEIHTISYKLWEEAVTAAVFDYSQEASKKYAFQAHQSLLDLFERSSSSSSINYSHLVCLQNVLYSMRDHGMTSDPKQLAIYANKLIQQVGKKAEAETKEGFLAFLKITSSSSKFLESLIPILTLSNEELVKAFNKIIPYQKDNQIVEMSHLIKNQFSLLKASPQDLLSILVCFLNRTHQICKDDTFYSMGCEFLTEIENDKAFSPIREDFFFTFINPYASLQIDVRSRMAYLLSTQFDANVFTKKRDESISLAKAILSNLSYGAPHPITFNCCRDLFISATTVLSSTDYVYLGKNIAQACLNHQFLENRGEVLIEFAQKIAKDSSSIFPAHKVLLLFRIVEAVLDTKDLSLYSAARTIYEIADSKQPILGGIVKLEVEEILKRLNQVRKESIIKDTLG